ncbi:MAG: hypothetical protein KGH57_04330 [Candidatus Micrarchaeota archaeon]|nr:hypothetical protein [Candidatus Micrarchaeota archaeon]
MSSTLEVGIDDIQTYVPKLRARCSDVVYHRHMRNNLETFLDVRFIATPNIDEDQVTFFFNSMVKVLDKNPELVEKLPDVRLRVTDEGGIDDSLSYALYTYPLVDMRYGTKFEHTVPIEGKLACISTGAAVPEALDAAILHGTITILGGTADAFYQPASKLRKSPGELTAGSGGATAVISRNPRLVTIDRESVREYSDFMLDFWRGKVLGKNMVVHLKRYPELAENGARSEVAYEFPAYKVVDQIEREVIHGSLLEHVDFIVAHRANGMMVWKTGASLGVHTLRTYHPARYGETLDEIRRINPEVEREPFLDGLKNYHQSIEVISKLSQVTKLLKRRDSQVVLGKIDEGKQMIGYYLGALDSLVGETHDELRKMAENRLKLSNAEMLTDLRPLQKKVDDFDMERRSFIRAFMKTGYYKEELVPKVQDSLELPRYIGNAYPAQWLFGLQSTAVMSQRRGKDIVGKKVFIYSMGSGAAGMGFIGRFNEGVVEYARNTDVSLINDEQKMTVLTSMEKGGLDVYEGLLRRKITEPLQEVRSDDKVVVLSAIFRDRERSYAFRDGVAIRKART